MPLMGGTLIALASSINYVLYGRITGLSGYLFSSLTGSPKGVFVERFCFLVGLVSLIDFYFGRHGTQFEGESVLRVEGSVDAAVMAVGGVLVGLGVRWGGGCTSGHGVCGIPRLSLRSFIAVPTFMATGMLTATLLPKFNPMLPHYLIDLSILDNYYYLKMLPKLILTFCQILAVLFNIHSNFTKASVSEKLKPLLFFLTGGLFGSGLLVSGMCNRAKILGFLTIGPDWDPSLLFVMMSAVGINFITFQGVMVWRRSVFANNIDLPYQKLDLGVFAGPALFGIGWGMTGYCPGPALANLTVAGYALPLVVAIFSGQYLFDTLEGVYYKINKPKKA